jgi:methylmalonyl-CoA carboxyltransferase 5S subunit
LKNGLLLLGYFCGECRMGRIVEITELALRDAHQSLLATRMGLDDMVPVCEEIDNAGYWSVECWGGATYDSCIRFLNEDPWERLRTFRKLMPKSRLQMLLRGQNLLGYRHYEDGVVERFVEKSAENGIDVFRIFDALNDVRNLQTSIAAVKRTGKHAQGTISYTVSPLHTVEAFAEMAAIPSALKTWPRCCGRSRLTTWCGRSRRSAAKRRWFMCTRTQPPESHWSR